MKYFPFYGSIWSLPSFDQVLEGLAIAINKRAHEMVTNRKEEFKPVSLFDY